MLLSFPFRATGAVPAQYAIGKTVRAELEWRELCHVFGYSAGFETGKIFGPYGDFLLTDFHNDLLGVASLKLRA